MTDHDNRAEEDQSVPFNPWSDRWEDMAINSEDGAMMRLEAQEGRFMPTRTCTEGHVAYYRVGVGGYWCKERHLAR